MPSRSPEYLRTGSRRRSQTVGSAATSRRRHMPASDTDRESRPPSAAARDIPVDIARLDALARSAVVRLPCCITRRARAWARSSLALTLSVLESKGSEGSWWVADGGLKSCANHPQQSATHRRHDARTVHNARTRPPRLWSECTRAGMVLVRAVRSAQATLTVPRIGGNDALPPSSGLGLDRRYGAFCRAR